MEKGRERPEKEREIERGKRKHESMQQQRYRDWKKDQGKHQKETGWERGGRKEKGERERERIDYTLPVARYT